MSNKKDIAVIPETGTALAEVDELALLFKENAGAGLENVRPEDVVLPRLSILQPTSPMSSEDGYRQGDIVNGITNENYGKSFEFYVLHYYPNRVMWETDEPGSDIECSSENNITGTKYGKCAECPHSQWGEKERPRCTEFKNLVVQPTDLDASPLVLSGKRAALKPVKTLISAMISARKPSFASRWLLEVVKNQKESLTWYTPKFTKVGEITTVAEFKTLKANSDSMAALQSRIKFDLENEPAPAADADGAGF